MTNFSNLTLVQGIEKILNSDEFEEGQDIVTKINHLIVEKKVLREGKVATLISERSSEKSSKSEKLDQSDQLEQSAVIDSPLFSEKAGELPVLQTENPGKNPPEIPSERHLTLTVLEEKTARRIHALPEHYYKMITQLLGNWEKQAQTKGEFRLNPPETDTQE